MSLALPQLDSHASVAAFFTEHASLPLPSIAADIRLQEAQVSAELAALISDTAGETTEVLADVCALDANFDRAAYAETISLYLERLKDNLSQSEALYNEARGRYQQLQYIKRKRLFTLKTAKCDAYCASFSKETAPHSFVELEVVVERLLWMKRFLKELDGSGQDGVGDAADLHARIQRFEDKLSQVLDAKTMELIAAQDVGLVIPLLIKLGKQSVFSAAFRIVVVYPALESFGKDCLVHTNETLFDFPKIVALMTSFADEIRSKWSSIIHPLFPNEADFWTRSLLWPILSWLQTSLSSVFVPSHLDTFQKNFKLAINFVKDIEAKFFEYEEDLAAFRKDDAWSGFMRKWPLNQYFQQRVKQLALPVENIMSHPLNSSFSQQPRILEQTLVAINALTHIWSHSVILTPLLPKFYKMSYQLMQRCLNFHSLDTAVNEPLDALNFITFALQKHYNVAYFKEALLSHVLPAINCFKIDEMPELANVICGEIFTSVDKIKQDYQQRLLSELLKKYDAQLQARVDFDGLTRISLKPLVILHQTHAQFELMAVAGLENIIDHIQNILLQINKAVFALLEAGCDGPAAQLFLEHMERLEAEAAVVGYTSLPKEAFWNEIKETFTARQANVLMSPSI